VTWQSRRLHGTPWDDLIGGTCQIRGLNGGEYLGNEIGGPEDEKWGPGS